MKKLIGLTLMACLISTFSFQNANATGEELMKKSDCFTCHKTDAKLVGPSFKEIAAKYKATDVDSLADKVIKGGAGVWGQIPMTAHPALKKEDVKKMIEWILTQK